MTDVGQAIFYSAAFVALALLYMFWPKSKDEAGVPVKAAAEPEPEIIGYYVQLYCCGLQLVRCADDETHPHDREERFYVCSECGREVWVVVRKQVTEAKDGSRNHASAGR
jgi:hypothetical protein